MAVHLLIVDALNLIRRIHAVQGSPCVDTCLHALEQLIVHSQPTHAVAVFDDEDRAHGWRHQRLPEYKAGRAPMPETLEAEMPALRAAFEQRGIRCWALAGNEADDLAATLAIKVAHAGHQVTLIDQSEDVVDTLGNSIDAICFQGNGASYATLQDLNAGSADLFIGVTQSDELNILSCFTAHMLGAKHTIARIRDTDYASQNHFYKDKLGISMVINPELATAMEISRTLRFPVATRVETFAGGRAELVEMTVKEEWPLVDKTLMEINRNLGIDLLFCAIVRNGQAFVPKGDTKIQAGDVIYLTGAAEKFRSSFRKLHLFKKPLQSVIIAGGGRVSHYLTGILLKQGLKVTVVDPRPHVAERLARECPGAAVMQDDVMRYFDSMLETDFAHTDAFIAITSNDEYNLVASMYAESQGISKVVTRINAKSRLKVLPKTSKICTISRNDVAADRIFAYSRSLMNASGDDKVESLYRLMDGKIEFIELNIDDKDKNLNIPLKNLKLKRNVLVAFIIRDTQTIIPRGDDEIHDGDTVLIGSINHHIAELKDIFAD